MFEYEFIKNPVLFFIKSQLNNKKTYDIYGYIRCLTF